VEEVIRTSRVQLHPKAKIVFNTKGPHSNFFGYYDKSPLDSSGQRLLAHRVTFDARDITAHDRTDVGFWNIKSETFTLLGETLAFNWQQGAMLQWLPQDYSQRIIYNDRKGNQFISVIVDIETGTRATLPFPIYAVHPSGKFALAANYERLNFCRPGYNYQGIIKSEWNRNIHEKDGIFRVDLTTGKTDLIIGTRQICNIAHLPEMEEHDNWLEHMMWNPAGTRFAFFHRWNDEKGGHTTRLFTADADGSNIYMFPHRGFYSHMGWRTDQEFTIWALKASSATKAIDRINRHENLKKVIRPAYRWLRDKVLGQKINALLPQAAYLECWDQSDRIEILGESVLTENGHNTWTKDGRWMLTDTYEDEKSYRHLLLYDSLKNEVVEIGKFYSPYNACGYRCDLHPRWDRSEGYVIIDSAHCDNKRQMYIIDVSRLKNKDVSLP